MAHGGSWKTKRIGAGFYELSHKQMALTHHSAASLSDSLAMEPCTMGHCNLIGASMQLQLSYNDNRTSHK